MKVFGGHKEAQMSRARAFVFTINNYTQEIIDDLMSKTNELSYIVFGEEIAPTTGTPHLQGYAHFKNPKTIVAARKTIPGHLEIARGTPEQNFNYTTKEGRSIHTFGEAPHQGKRTDIQKMRELAKSGATIMDLIEEATSYQTLRMAETLSKYSKPRERNEVEVLWFHGETGTGKTRTAVKLGGDDYWMTSKGLRWWDGYYGQKTVIIDDFRADFCTFHELLRILDRYPYRVETKGSSQYLNADRIIITAPYPPDNYYGNQSGEAHEQLMRRITSIRPFYKPEEMEWPNEDVFN